VRKPIANDAEFIPKSTIMNFRVASC